MGWFLFPVFPYPDVFLNFGYQDFPGGPPLRAPSAGCSGSVPGRGTRFHMPQLEFARRD